MPEDLMMLLGGCARLLLAYLLGRRLLRDLRDRRLTWPPLRAGLGLAAEAALMAGLGYLLWGQWAYWPGPLLIAGGYLLTAGGAHLAHRAGLPARGVVLAELGVQGLGLLALAGLVGPGWSLMPLLDMLAQPHLALLACAYVLVWWPAGYFIQWLTEPWQRAWQAQAEGLPRAGRWIGYLERSLVLTFVLLDALSAIGFLITAKSILRFGEISDPANRKGAEYILIGTLISFLWAIGLGLAVRQLLGGG